MYERKLTPREKIEARREERELRRSFLKHHGRINVQRICAIWCEYLGLLKVLDTKKYLRFTEKTLLLGHTLLLAKFCNGLIGVSLTDSLPAPAIN